MSRGLAICAAWPSTSTCSCGAAPDDLVEVIDKKPELLGLGIDEPAAVVVQGDRMEVIGRSVVGIYDGKDHDGKKYYFLAPGEQFDLRSRKRVAKAPKTRDRRACDRPRRRPIPRRTAKPAIDAYIKSHADTAWEMARKIWDWAEVGYQEKRSSALLADALEAGGFKVERGVAGIPTSFIATIGSGKPVIGILGEYDALPGLSQQAVPERQARAGATAGHGCGHHLFGVASAIGVPGAGRADQGRDAQGHAAVLRLPGRGRGQCQGVHGASPSLRRLRRRAALAPGEPELGGRAGRARRGSRSSSGSTARARTRPPRPKWADPRSTRSS